MPKNLTEELEEWRRSQKSRGVYNIDRNQEDE